MFLSLCSEVAIFKKVSCFETKRNLCPAAKIEPQFPNMVNFPGIWPQVLIGSQHDVNDLQLHFFKKVKWDHNLVLWFL